MKQSPTISNSISFRRSLVRRQGTRQPGAKQNEFGRVDISRERVLPRPPADLPSLPNATCAAAFGGAGLTLAEWRDAEEQLEQKLAQIKLTNGGNKIPASW